VSTHLVNTHAAKSRLSELIRKVEAGEEVILARNGTPVAKIIPWPPPRPVRRPGAWMGRVGYLSDVVGSDEDVNALFEDSTGRAEP
jgi:prevent-host-death family protein